MPNGLRPRQHFRGFYLDRGSKKLSKLGPKKHNFAFTPQQWPTASTLCMCGSAKQIEREEKREKNQTIKEREGECQKFRKGVGGQRGLARRNPSYAGHSGLFSVPLFLGLLRRTATHYWSLFWAIFGGVFVATPSRQPLFETSESGRRKKH